MNATRTLEALKSMVLQKRDFKESLKDINETIKINNEQIDNTILDDGDIRACRKLLQDNYSMLTMRKELQGKIKLVAESIEKTIMGDGNEGQAEMFDEDPNYKEVES